jgi:segregation and condensation protein B
MAVELQSASRSSGLADERMEAEGGGPTIAEVRSPASPDVGSAAEGVGPLLEDGEVATARRGRGHQGRGDGHRSGANGEVPWESGGADAAIAPSAHAPPPGGDDPAPVPGSDTAMRPGLEKAPPIPISAEHLKTVIESLVFVADKPISAHRIARLARAGTAVVERLLAQLAEEYRGRGIQLVEVAGGWQFRSAAENASFVRELIGRKPARLTRAQLETLAIIAYRQPVTRPEIEEIRGVDSGSALNVLLERNLVKIIGRKEEPGRPLLYGTTPQFLEFFGLRSLADLPTLKEDSELSEESRALFARRTGESFEDIRDVTVEAGAPHGQRDGDHRGDGRDDEEEEDAS